MALIRRMKQQGGFTLVEMMMVMLVVGILMTIAIPSVQTYIHRAELRSSARKVAEVLRNSRDSAMNEGRPRYVLFDVATQTYVQFKIAPAAGGGYEWVRERRAAVLDRSVTFTDAGVTFPALSNMPVTGLNVPANAAYFGTRGRYPQGVSPAGPYLITLTSADRRSRTITVYERTGEVTGV